MSISTNIQQQQWKPGPKEIKADLELVNICLFGALSVQKISGFHDLHKSLFVFRAFKNNFSLAPPAALLPTLQTLNLAAMNSRGDGKVTQAQWQQQDI